MTMTSHAREDIFDQYPTKNVHWRSSLVTRRHRKCPPQNVLKLAALLAAVSPAGPTRRPSTRAEKAQDLLAGVPAAVPSGAFGGSEDQSISAQGHVAFSARPPLAPDEAWTTNRHIYLKKIGDDGLGTCITSNNPGYDTNPAFSPNGTAGADHEADAVGIRVHDLATGETTTLLEAEADWDYSPHSLTWSKDGARLYFAADVRSRGALCSVDATKGAKEGGIAVHTWEGSPSLHGEVGSVNGRHAFLASVQSDGAVPRDGPRRWGRRLPEAAHPLQHATGRGDRPGEAG